MTNRSANNMRVLAIDPTHRGFGYAVFEGPLRLVDWGTRDVRGAKNVSCIEATARLIALYRPSALIVEDGAARGSRRRERVQQLIYELGELARRHKVQVRRVSRLRVRKTFASQGASNKHEIACVIAAQFSDLTSRLPPKRKPWMSEDLRMAIFDAAAFAIAFFSRGINAARSSSPASTNDFRAGINVMLRRL